MATVEFNVHGMSCAGCAQSIERRLMVTPGVQTATVNLAAKTASVTYDDAVTNPNALEKAIENLGFDVEYGLGRTS